MADRRRASKIAQARNARGVSQRQLAEAVGISVATLRRLERGEMPNPPLRYVFNIALALRATPVEVFEDEWREWYPLPGAPRRPPTLGPQQP